MDLSIENHKAARLMLDRGRIRSSISRAYYAAYSALTHELRKSAAIQFPAGRDNPSHGRLLDYVQTVLPTLGHSAGAVSAIKSAVRDLRRSREQADYIPASDLDATDAHRRLRDAESVLLQLGVPL